jgi:hypothetical protein
MVVFSCNNSSLYYTENYGVINDYCQYIIELVKQIYMNNPNLCVNILLLDDSFDFANNNKTIRININYEHTLVKQGGRTSYGSHNGKILDDQGNYYLVRIDRYNELYNSDVIIDYSIPNIHNVLVSGLFPEFVKKHLYISCSIYDCYFIRENRNISFLTTFINTNEHRRHKLLESIDKKKHINVNNCFDKDDIQNLYKNTKILINIHQTDHHHTLEELRVLPALRCGVIVISEISPLTEYVPYNSYIIWSTYENILNKANEVLENYEEIHQSIFNDNTLHHLEQIKCDNYDIIKNKIMD